MKLGPWRFTWALHRGLYQPPTPEQQAQEAVGSACICGVEEWRGRFKSDVWNQHWAPCPLAGQQAALDEFHKDAKTLTEVMTEAEAQNPLYQMPPWGATQELAGPLKASDFTHSMSPPSGPERCSWCDVRGWLGIYPYQQHRDDCPYRSGKMRLSPEATQEGV